MSTMSLKQILGLTGAGVFLALIGLVSVVLFIPPEELFPWSVILMYGLLFLVTLGVSTLVGTLVRVYIRRASVPVRQLMRSFRQGVLLSVLVCVALWLSHAELLSAWSMLFLILGLGFVELFFLTSRSRST